MTRCLCLSACCTGLAVIHYEFLEFGPGVFPLDKTQCLVLSEMSRERVVVLISENSESEVIGIGNVDFSVVTEETFRIQRPMGVIRVVLN